MPATSQLDWLILSSRSGRGWVDWPQVELARRANVSERTVETFEGGQKPPYPNRTAAIRRAIEESAVRLLFEKKGATAGILRREPTQTYRATLLSSGPSGIGVFGCDSYFF